MTTYWWVNQGESHSRQIKGGYMWSPKVQINGTSNPFWDSMREVTIGDIVFSYYQQHLSAVGIVTSEHSTLKNPNPNKNGRYFGLDGWHVEVDYLELPTDKRLNPQNHIEAIAPLLPDKYSPLTKECKGRQQYLTKLPLELGETLHNLLPKGSIKETKSITKKRRARTYDKREAIIDSEFQSDVADASPADIPETPQKKPPQSKSSRSTGWKRDPRIAKASLKKANYLCEVSKDHQTFISSSSNTRYMEAHHLIPMSYQKDFKFSLDVPENIASLCPNCHKMIHLATHEDRKKLIKMLFTAKRQGKLKNTRGINIDLATLCEMYE